MQWIIDRIEGDIAVIETENGIIEIPVFALPAGISEGNIIKISLDSAAEETRRERIKEKMDRLFKES